MIWNKLNSKFSKHGNSSYSLVFCIIPWGVLMTIHIHVHNNKNIKILEWLWYMVKISKYLWWRFFGKIAAFNRPLFSQKCPIISNCQGLKYASVCSWLWTGTSWISMAFQVWDWMINFHITVENRLWRAEESHKSIINFN